MPQKMLRTLLTLTLFIFTVHGDPCVPRDFGNGGDVCVCNATYCDFLPQTIVPERGQFLQYTSSKDGLRLHELRKDFSNETAGNITLELNPEIRYQTIHGFGGAFTDATGINLKKLSSGAQKNLIRSYFSKEGSNYNLGRVPIGGTDFSIREYTLDDVPNDTKLEHFSLAEEDLIYRIPLIQKAMEINPEMKFMATPWTAPHWMKMYNGFGEAGFLKQEYYQLYTDYLIKFMNEYKKHGLEMWALTTGNEPSLSIVAGVKQNAMIWTPGTVSKWVAENLGPTLRASESGETIILALDDQRYNLPWAIVGMFQNEAAKNYTAGIAVHWYFDNVIPPTVLDMTHDDYSEKFLIMTEACINEKHPPGSPAVRLGSWSRGERYVTDIIQDLNHWITGWVDWNLVLDKQGGPNWVKNYVDATIIVNPETDEFYKQPTFYAIAHFSKFIPRGSVRIELSKTTDIKSVAFKTPDDEITVILYNTRNDTQHVTVHDPDRGNMVLHLPRYSIHTIIYK